MWLAGHWSAAVGRQREGGADTRRPPLRELHARSVRGRGVGELEEAGEKVASVLSAASGSKTVAPPKLLDSEGALS